MKKTENDRREWRRRVERAISAIAVLYLVLQTFPQIVFAHQAVTDGITVFSRHELPPSASDRVSEALHLTERSELHLPNGKPRVFLCDNRALFRLFAPVSPKAFAISVPVTENIFLADTDIARNISRSSASRYNRRTLSSVIAHEMTHSLVRHALGLKRAFFLPAWIAEGYCDYIAQQSSFPETEGLRLIRSSQSDPSPAFHYFVWRKMVQHLVDDEHYSFAQIVARAGDSERVKNETTAALQQQ